MVGLWGMVRGMLAKIGDMLFTTCPLFSVSLVATDELHRLYDGGNTDSPTPAHHLHAGFSVDSFQMMNHL